MTTPAQSEDPSQDQSVDWSWDRFIAILAGETGEAERQNATRFLRSAQGYSFEKLRDAIDDPDHVTSWQDPWLGIRMEIPWESVKSVPRKDFDPKIHKRPGVGEDFIDFDLLVAGARILVEDDMAYPLMPIPLLEGAARLPSEKVKPAAATSTDISHAGDNPIPVLPHPRRRRADGSGRDQVPMSHLKSPEPTQSRFTEVDGLRLRYLTAGSGVRVQSGCQPSHRQVVDPSCLSFDQSALSSPVRCLTAGSSADTARDDLSRFQTRLRTHPITTGCGRRSQSLGATATRRRKSMTMSSSHRASSL